MRDPPRRFLRFVITPYTIILLAVLMLLWPDEPPRVPLAENVVVRGAEEPSVARPAASVGLGLNDSELQLVIVEPDRPPFVWDYKLTPGLHGEPITYDEAWQHLRNACEGTGCEWWASMMVDI